MNVTASRLGSSPITIDWSGLVKIPAQGQLAPNPQTYSQEWTHAWNRLKSRFLQGEVGFYDTPTNPELSQHQETQALAQELLKQHQFTDCLFLGIGGSALGPLSLLGALQEKCNQKIRFHIVDNPDPVEWKATLGRLSPQSTLVCVVTKSGTTFETIAQMLLALEWLGKNRWKSHLVAITDPAKGDLKSFASKEEIPTLHIAPSIGGRFSVFSPVGLFPLALSGLNGSEFLLGARQVRDYIDKTPMEKNPILIVAQEMIRQSKQRPIHVCMPYSTRLKLISNWFVQLWGESLGKDGKGFTPIAAVGATDQHSILQLLRDGPDDKITMFLNVDQIEDAVKIPKVALGHQHPIYNSFRLLEGHTLQELLLTEYRATALVLTKQNRPNFTLTIDRLDERSLGALYFTYCVLTAFTGTLMGVNPFDQPGVEEGKIYTREALSGQK